MHNNQRAAKFLAEGLVGLSVALAGFGTLGIVVTGVRALGLALGIGAAASGGAGLLGAIGALGTISAGPIALAIAALGALAVALHFWGDKSPEEKEKDARERRENRGKLPTLDDATSWLTDKSPNRRGASHWVMPKSPTTPGPLSAYLPGFDFRETYLPTAFRQQPIDIHITTKLNGRTVAVEVARVIGDELHRPPTGRPRFDGSMSPTYPGSAGSNGGF